MQQENYQQQPALLNPANVTDEQIQRMQEQINVLTQQLANSDQAFVNLNTSQNSHLLWGGKPDTFLG